MKYLENAFKFLGKFYLLLIPLFISVAIPNIISGPSNNSFSAQFEEIMKTIATDPTIAQDSTALLNLFSTLNTSMPLALLGGGIAFILGLIVKPATYGMVNKALETGNADLNDFVPEMKNNIAKYILFGLVSIGIYMGITIVAIVIFAVIIALMVKSTGLGVLLLFLFVIALMIGIFVFSYLTFLWFPAMISDDLGVFDGFKRSISVAKSYFWPIVGISLLITMGASVASLILGIFGGIPVIGPAIISLVAVVVEFIMIVFAFEVYRDKTGKNEYINEDLPYEAPGDYL